MKKRLLKFLEQTDIAAVLANSARLLALELPQTFEAYHASAAETVRILEENGFENVEKLTFPADGKTVWQDKISPLGWSASVGKLVVESACGIEKGMVIADYAKHPFYLIKGSCATACGGEKMRLVSYENVLAGVDPAGALVLSPVDQDCRCRALRGLLDMGARGVVSDFSFNKADGPEGILWNTAFTEFDNWHVNRDDREFIAFSISPATGKILRQAVEKGEVILHVESDGKRFESTFDAVTALVPGRRKEEFWIFAHLYEPLANDNSSGVAGAIETARLIREQGIQEFSLRLIFTMEHYGYAAYAVHRGDRNLSNEVVGACDYDAMRIRENWDIDLRCAAPGTPFYGNTLLHQLAKELKNMPDAPRVEVRDSFGCMYDDDAFLSDSTTGVPVVWPIRKGEGIYHNSLQTIDYIEPEALRFACAVNTALVQAFLSPQAEMVRQAAENGIEILKKESARSVGAFAEHLAYRFGILKQDIQNFDRCIKEEVISENLARLQECYLKLSKPDSGTLPHSPCRDLAEKLIFSRLTTGFPFDLAKVPFKERILLPDSLLYGPLSSLLSDMDGVKDLAQLIRQSEHLAGKLLEENKIKELIEALFYLARYGYLRLTFSAGTDIEAALQNAGIELPELSFNKIMEAM